MADACSGCATLGTVRLWDSLPFRERCNAHAYAPPGALICTCGTLFKTTFVRASKRPRSGWPEEEMASKVARVVCAVSSDPPMWPFPSSAAANCWARWGRPGFRSLSARPRRSLRMPCCEPGAFRFHAQPEAPRMPGTTAPPVRQPITRDAAKNAAKNYRGDQ